MLETDHSLDLFFIHPGMSGPIKQIQTIILALLVNTCVLTGEVLPKAQCILKKEHIVEHTFNDARNP